MQRPEIEAHVGEYESWRIACKEVKDAFVETMSDKQYGYEACTDAWSWFYTGWCAHITFSLAETYEG